MAAFVRHVPGRGRQAARGYVSIMQGEKTRMSPRWGLLALILIAGVASFALVEYLAAPPGAELILQIVTLGAMFGFTALWIRGNRVALSEQAPVSSVRCVDDAMPAPSSREDCADGSGRDEGPRETRVGTSRAREPNRPSRIGGHRHFR